MENAERLRRKRLRTIWGLLTHPTISADVKLGWDDWRPSLSGNTRMREPEVHYGVYRGACEGVCESQTRILENTFTFMQVMMGWMHGVRRSTTGASTPMLSTEYMVRLVLVLLVLDLSTVHKWCSMTASTHSRLHSPTPRPGQICVVALPPFSPSFSKLGCLETPHSVLRGHTTETAGA